MGSASQQLTVPLLQRLHKAAAAEAEAGQLVMLAFVDCSGGVSFTVLHSGLVPPSEGIVRTQTQAPPRELPSKAAVVTPEPVAATPEPAVGLPEPVASTPESAVAASEPAATTPEPAVVPQGPAALLEPAAAPEPAADVVVC